jgi:2'-hydroxyisoflavone reductase
MRLLIIGGSAFLGRHVIESALSRGDTVTTFNRGKTGRGLYPQVEELYGDRDGNLEALKGRTWDAVVDTSGYLPRVVRQSVELLAGSVGHYTFVSSLSAYGDDNTPNGDESIPLARMDDAPDSEEIMKYYGALKARCEQTVEEFFPGKSVFARAGLIIGKYDQINRFPYWIKRVAKGGETLAPGDPNAPIQAIDARDLTDFMLHAAENGKSGAFNLTGKTTTIGEILNTVRDVVNPDTRFVWVSDQFLSEHEITPMDGVPFWMPPEIREAFFTRRIDKALAAGLTFRPLTETVRETHDGIVNSPPPPEKETGVRLNSGLPPEREAELLAAWHAQEQTT